MTKSILIVEDEIAIADSIAYALGTEGYSSTHVSLGESALDALRSATQPGYQLVVLDIGLPDINGFEVCRRMRQFSDVPVIFLTARSDEIDRIVGLEIGADDYVTKPFSPRELVARIRVILRRLDSQQKRDNSQSAPASVPVFDLREKEAKIFFHGLPLDLTRYEYMLLKTFLANAGHLMSRSQLMDLVWENAPDTLERTVDAHVKSLRAKLHAARVDSDYIQTHRGMGYSLKKS